MRSEVEKLPQIESYLHNVVFDEGSNEYLAKKMGHLPFEFSEWFLNGSWTIYQHQQSKVDELQKRVDDLTELNRLKTIALQQSVNRTSPSVHEKIVALEQAIKGGGE